MKWIIILALALTTGQAVAQEAAQGRLIVTGEGAVDSVPDMATITMGVTSEAKTAAQAMAETSQATAAVIDALTGAGIEPRDMQTRDLSLNPVWDNRSTGERGIIGFQASNTVIVRVRDLPQLGGILDQVIRGGANEFRGLSFGLQEPGPAMDEARRRAVAEAMRKAALYAEAAGLTLGPVLEFTESGGSPVPMMMERAAMAMSVPIATGEVTTNTSVTMIFALDNDAGTPGLQ